MLLSLRARVVALGVPLLLTACGTTVPVGDPGLAAAPDAGLGTALGMGPGTSTGTATPADRSPAVRTATAGSTDPLLDAAARGSAAAAPASRTRSAAEVAGVAPGVLRVGTYFFDSASTNALTSSVGANAEMGDMRAQQRAVAAWVNARGGVAGRELQLVQHQVDIQGDPSTEAQSLCEAWTRDRSVFAGIGSLPTANPVLVSCLAKARTLSIGGSSSNVGTAADFQRWAPYYYAPASVELVSAGRIYAEGLLDKGFLDEDSRIGVLYVESPEHQAALRQGLLPTLARAGVTPTDLVGVRYDGSYADYGNLVSQAQSATLRFRSREVTHVLFVDTGGALAFWFMQQAQSQGYNPAYGLSTLSAPAFQEASVDPRQLAGAVAVGWRPADDVHQSRLPGNPARALCQQIMKDAGQQAKSPFDLQLQLTTCSGFFLLRAALDRATALTPAAFQSAVAGLGSTNVPSAAGFSDRYAPGKPWGGSGYATASFSDACRCFRYDARDRRL